MERFNLWKLRELEVLNQYQNNISKRTAPLRTSEDINRAWENIKENIKISARV